MAIAEAYSGSNTLVIAAETVLNTSTPETTDGIYQLFVDTNAMAAGDTLEIRVKEKATSGSTQRGCIIDTLVNAQSANDCLWVSPSLILLHGWDMTLTQTTGTGRLFYWSIRRVS